jgi:hypothetical protein
VSQEIHPGVLDALEKALQQEGACRLVSRAKKPGLLSGTAKAVAELRDLCLNPDLNLFTVERTEEEKSGKTVQTVHYVVITPDGIQTLFDRRPVEQLPGLYERAAGPHKEAALAAGFRTAERASAEFGAQRQQLLAREANLFAFLRQTVHDRLQSLRQERERLDGTLQAVDQLRELLHQPGAPSPAGQPTRPARLGTAGPTAETDLDFQRDVAEELVYAWQDAGDDPGARGALERVMTNAGLEPEGEAGQSVTFDGRRHVSDDPLDSGDAGFITEPGWRLVNARGNYLIARARVRRAPSPREAPRVRQD